MTYGHIAGESIVNAKEAIYLYIESLKAYDEEISAEGNMLEDTFTLNAHVLTIFNNIGQDN